MDTGSFALPTRIIKRKPVIDGLFAFSAFVSDAVDGIQATRFLDL
ncbi:Unknown protein sequence [Pseudomonas syringae pv. cilantro]|uniref:Uncharacterized protein n=2 Tax=Pseudomonas syringae group TaxID=136849 RepID=A0A0N0GE71_PSESX|nr:Unknown protein sequence [Pseudomonas syringae pv. cilantro]KPW81272.1 hypothetical protein ALO76_102386 [Pseudomonas syringae pv. coriandricola]RMN08084.1 hypothetical protein ALQ65_102209 [Pseudomonas syringae pv. coriandricola]